MLLTKILKHVLKKKCRQHLQSLSMILILILILILIITTTIIIIGIITIIIIITIISIIIMIIISITTTISITISLPREDKCIVYDMAQVSLLLLFRCWYASEWHQKRRNDRFFSLTKYQILKTTARYFGKYSIIYILYTTYKHTIYYCSKHVNLCILCSISYLGCTKRPFRRSTYVLQ